MIVSLMMAFVAILLMGCSPADTPTAEPTAAPAAQAADQPTPVEAATTVVEFWTTDQQPARIAAYEAVAQRFMVANPAVEVRVVAKDEASITSILVGIAVLGWLVLDWLESTQHWETPEVDPKLVVGQSEQARLDTLDVESELMHGYPIDSYSPALSSSPSQFPNPQGDTLRVFYFPQSGIDII